MSFTAIRRDPSAAAGLGEPPMLMGYSFGGLIVQILLDRADPLLI